MATKYVATTGNNGAAGDIGTPWLTLTYALTQIGAGDTVLMRVGNYDEGIATSPSGTSWSNKVRIAAYPGETVWLKPLSIGTSAGGTGMVIWLDGNFSYIEFDGINLDGTVAPGGSNVMWVSTNNGNNPHHIRFQNAEVIAGAIGASAAISLGGHTSIGATGSNEIINVTIHGGGLPGLCGFQCASYGVYLAGPNNLVERCDIYDTSGAGVQIYGTGDPADYNIVRKNRIHAITRAGSLNQVWGIIIDGNNNQVYNNLIYDINYGAVNPGNAGIAVTKADNKLWNNTIANNTNSGIYIGSGANGTEVRNNISYQNGGSNLVDQGTGSVFSHNLFGIDPAFVNAGGGDYTLQSWSVAIDAGITLATVPDDFDGVVRPAGSAYDIGAYEFGGMTTPPPPPPPPPPPSSFPGLPQAIFSRTYTRFGTAGSDVSGLSAWTGLRASAWTDLFDFFEADAQHPWSADGTFTNLRVRLDKSGGLGGTVPSGFSVDVHYIIRIAGADAIVLVLPAGQNSAVTSVSGTIVAGNLVVIKRLVPGGAGIYSELRAYDTQISLTFYGANGISGYASSAGELPVVLDNASTYYASPLVAHDFPWTINTPAQSVNAFSVVAAAGNLVRSDVLLRVAPGGSASRTFTYMVNSVLQDGSGGTVDTRLTISGAATQGFATFVLPLLPRDHLTLVETPSGSPTASAAQFSNAFQPTVQGQHNLAFTSRNASPIQTEPDWAGAINSGWAKTSYSYAQGLTEVDMAIDVGLTPVTIAGLYVAVTNNTNSAGSYALQSNKNLTAAGGPVVTVQAIGTNHTEHSNSGLTTYSLPSDQYGFQSTPSNSPSTIALTWTFLLTSPIGSTVPPPTPPAPPTPCIPTPVGNGGTGASGCNKGGVGWTPCYVGPYGAVPQHADPTPGLGTEDVWVEVIHEDYPSGVKTSYRRAFQEIADLDTYHGGRKPAGLLSVGDIENSLANEQGAAEGTTVNLELSDVDRFWRTLLDTQDLEGDELRVFLSDKARREAGLPSRVLMRASIQKSPTSSQLRTVLQTVDELYSDAGPFGPNRTFPDQKIPAGVWLTTPPQSLEQFLPSLWGYKSDEGAVNPITNTLAEKGLIPLTYVGQQQIGGSVGTLVPPHLLPQNYALGIPWGAFATDFIGGGTMSGRVWALVTSVVNGEESLTSNLAGTIENNRAMIVNWSRPLGAPQVDYYRVYFFLSAASGFAEFSPTTWQTTPAVRFLTHDNFTIDGNGGADFSVTIPDFTVGTDYLAGLTTVVQPNIWDAYLVTLGTMYKICSLFGSDLGGGIPTNAHDRVKIDLASRAGSEFLVPGYLGWPFPNPYVEYTAPDGTVYWLTMIFAKGPVSDDHKNGVVNMTVNGYGYESVGDGTGLPIMNVQRCRQHWYENFILRRYTSGVWVTTSTAPKWDDGTPKVRSSSFTAAETYEILKVGGAGYTASWYVSEPKANTVWDKIWNTETETKRGVNNEGQLMVWFLDEFVVTTNWPRVRHITDLFGPIARSPGQERENVIVGVCDWDPDVKKFRSNTLKLESPNGIQKYKNRRKQGDEIQSVILNDSAHLQSLLQRRLRRLEFGEVRVDNKGKIDLIANDVSQGILVTTIEGTGASGDVDRPYVIARRRVGLQSRLVGNTLIDLTGLVIPPAQQFVITGPSTPTLGSGGFLVGS